VPEPPADPLHFRDQKKYPDRLKAAQKASGEREAMLVAEGDIGRTPIVAAAQDFSFMAGSMGLYVGNAILAGAERAVKLKRPFVLFSAAGGARMQEGILSLMQLPKTVCAVDELHEARCAFISVMTHPTTAGVLASFASLGDVIVSEPGALLAFTGPRVVQQTTREKLPDDFGLAESNARFGHVDAIVPRAELRPFVGRLLAMFVQAQ